MTGTFLRKVLTISSIAYWSPGELGGSVGRSVLAVDYRKCRRAGNFNAFMLFVWLLSVDLCWFDGVYRGAVVWWGRQFDEPVLILLLISWRR